PGPCGRRVGRAAYGAAPPGTRAPATGGRSRSRPTSRATRARAPPVESRAGAGRGRWRVDHRANIGFGAPLSMEAIIADRCRALAERSRKVGSRAGSALAAVTGLVVAFALLAPGASGQSLAVGDPV